MLSGSLGVVEGIVIQTTLELQIAGQTGTCEMVGEQARSAEPMRVNSDARRLYQNDNVPTAENLVG